MKQILIRLFTVVPAMLVAMILSVLALNAAHAQPENTSTVASHPESATVHETAKINTGN